MRGLRLTCFTDAEEEETGLNDAVPFLLESKLRELGANVQTMAPFTSHVEEDDWLLTGQNPRSSEKLAKALAARLVG